MHYKNGRLAHEGDSVIGKAYVGKERIVAGTVHSLTPGSDTCNGQLAVPVPGGVTNVCVTLKELYHAEDAMAAKDTEQANAETKTEAK